MLADYNDTEADPGRHRGPGRPLAAVILEPMLGGGGCIPAEPGFLHALRAATDRHGIVLIFDEVMTSRLAPGGLQAEVGVTPDLTTLGKYVGGGMSFGAFGGHAELMARFDPRRPDALPHAGTFNNNVLTMAAGIAALTEVYTPDGAAALNARGEALRERLNALAGQAGVAMQVDRAARCWGCICCAARSARPPMRPAATCVPATCFSSTCSGPASGWPGAA